MPQEINIKLLPHQMDVLKSTKPLYGIMGGRGIGKSVICSILAAIKFNENKRVLILAQTNKAISENIFKELLYWLDKFKMTYKPNMTNLTIDNGHGGRIITGSYEGLSNIRGLTNISLAICDEIALAPPDLFAVLSPVLRGEGIVPMIRFATTPRFASWWNRYVIENNVEYAYAKTIDNTFLTKESIELMAKSITDERLKQQELEGIMLDGAGDNIIIGTKDFMAVKPNEFFNSQRYYIGCDCSGFGKDNNAIVIRNDQEIIKIIKRQVASSEELFALIESFIRTKGYDPEYIAIDLAYGNALYERLVTRYNTILVPFSGKSENDSYYNKRSEMYFNLVKAIKEGFYVEDLDVRYDLTNTTYTLKGDKILLDPKDIIKEVIGHSPDVCDALALTFLYKYNNIRNEMEKDNDKFYFQTLMSEEF